MDALTQHMKLQIGWIRLTRWHLGCDSTVERDNLTPVLAAAALVL
jgi:hypothetical protein